MGELNNYLQRIVIKKSVIISQTAVTHQENFTVRTKSALIFLIFILMYLFRLNSHISVISLEGGGTI